MGYLGSDQDTIISKMITSAREWLEQRTSLSIVSKSYKAYFEKEDAEDGWYELPVSPVLALPAITITMNGVSTTFQQRGLSKIRVMPDSVISTVLVGATSRPSYIEVVFQAGATNLTANECIKKIVSSMFNHREDGEGVSVTRIPFDTLAMIESISQNTNM